MSSSPLLGDIALPSARLMLVATLLALRVALPTGASPATLPDLARIGPPPPAPRRRE